MYVCIYLILHEHLKRKTLLEIIKSCKIVTDCNPTRHPCWRFYMRFETIIIQHMILRNIQNVSPLNKLAKVLEG